VVIPLVEVIGFLEIEIFKKAAWGVFSGFGVKGNGSIAGSQNPA